MPRPLLIPLPGNYGFAKRLAAWLGAELGAAEFRRFPDGESLVRIATPVAGRSVAFVCTLARPDSKTVRLLLAAGAARDEGAVRVGLVAPYLAYMRQDSRFRPGESVSARHFARTLSATFDWLVTVDPHLHRLAGLDDVYRVPARSVRSAPVLAEWVRRNVVSPLVVGPDEESSPLVEGVAAAVDAPWVAARKVRRGDHDVEVSVPELAQWRGRTPVVVDDIVSTGSTMVQAAERLHAAGFATPICLAVHAIFAGDAAARLRAAGYSRVLTCNTVRHETNAMDVTESVADAVRELV